MSKIECANCGRSNQADAIFCVGCGTRIQNDSSFTESFSSAPSHITLKSKDGYCPACGVELTNGSVFCEACGFRIPTKPSLPEHQTIITKEHLHNEPESQEWADYGDTIIPDIPEDSSLSTTASKSDNESEPFSIYNLIKDASENAELHSSKLASDINRGENEFSTSMSISDVKAGSPSNPKDCPESRLVINMHGHSSSKLKNQSDAFKPISDFDD